MKNVLIPSFIIYAVEEESEQSAGQDKWKKL